MDGTTRLTFSIVAVAFAVLVEESAGTKTPFSRKERMFERRSREDAEGERMIMGSGLRCDLGLCGRVGLLAIAAAACAALRALNGAASFRTCEKSCILLATHPASMSRLGWYGVQ